MNKISYKTICYVIFAMFSMLILSACNDDNQTNNSAQMETRSGLGGKRTPKPVPIEAKQPVAGIAASYYITTATIEPSSDAKINSRTSGVVKQILHEEGDDVLSGEVLLILDDEDQQLRLKQTVQQVASATREFKRLNKMKKSGMASPIEWETADNNLMIAQTNNKLAELALSYTRVAAPFDGRVVWREVDLGAHVSQGELLFRMMAIRPLLVRVHIPANRLGQVAVGQTVTLTIDSVTERLNAQIELISPIVDPTTGTIKITLRLDQYPEKVRPGDFTEIQMVTDRHQQALLVPSVAIIEERGQHFLYTVVKGKAYRKEVTTGFVMSENTEIISGITATDSIVVKGQRTLNDDVPVELLDSDGKIEKLANEEGGDKPPANSQVRKKQKERASKRGQP